MKQTRLMIRHSKCGGFIMPDEKNSLEALLYGKCTKCGAEKLSKSEMNIDTEDNVNLGEYFVVKNNNNEDSYLRINDSIIVFDSKEKAENLLSGLNIDKSNYSVLSLDEAEEVKPAKLTNVIEAEGIIRK